MKIFYPFTVKLEPNSHYNVTGTVEALVSAWPPWDLQKCYFVT